MLTAPLIFALPPRIKSRAAMIFILAGAIIASVGAVTAITTGSCSWMSGLDRVSGVFTLAIAIVGASAAIYSVGCLKVWEGVKSRTQISIHLMAMIVLFYSMIAIMTSTGKFEFLFWWELMTLSSFLLVIFDGARKEVLHAGIGYLIIMHISFFFLLVAFNSTPGELWSAVSMPSWLLFLVGFGLKSAIFPLHIWLPVTYLNTPSHVAALMSGVMINMGVYGIFRISMVYPDPYTIGIILISVGIISGFFGIIKAATHTGLKRLLGYSSIENIGIIVLAIGLGCIGKAIDSQPLIFGGWGGALLHTLNHSSYKSMLFMGVGAVDRATGKSDLNRLGGLMKQMPITGWLFALASLAICAIPPMSGFFSEFSILSGLFSAVASGQEPIIGIIGIVSLALIGGIAILAFSKAFSITFLGQARSCAARDATEVDSWMISASALPLISITLGGILYPVIILPGTPLLESMFTIEAACGVMIALVVALILIRRWLQRGRVITTQPTWGCAFTAPDKKMQYTASSFSRELGKTITTQVEPLIVDQPIFPTAQSFKTEHTDKTNRLVTSFSQRILHRWTARLALFQTGKTSHYILHALVFLILILILSLTGAI